MTGYAGIGNIIDFTNSYTNNYNSLQMQLNRRVGRLQWNLNYTFSRTIVYNNSRRKPPLLQFVNAQLTKNVHQPPPRHQLQLRLRPARREPQAVEQCGRQGGAGRLAPQRQRLDLRGHAVHRGLQPPPDQPSQFWTGTPTAYLPFRCQMGSNIFLTDGSLPSKTEDPRLQVPLNTANFTLPAANSLGIGNTPPTLFYGPWLWNLDFSLAKMTRIAEGKTLELRVETFNTFNHFNPSNPNTSLTYNFTSGAHRPTRTFGTITERADRSAARSAVGAFQVLRQTLPDGRGSDEEPRPSWRISGIAIRNGNANITGCGRPGGGLRTELGSGLAHRRRQRPAHRLAEGREDPQHGQRQGHEAAVEDQARQRSPPDALAAAGADRRTRQHSGGPEGDRASRRASRTISSRSTRRPAKRFGRSTSRAPGRRRPPAAGAAAFCAPAASPPRR